MTSKHLQENPDNSMYSQLDFHAKIYPSLEDKKVSEKEQDQDYSTKVSGYLGKFDLDSPDLKTLEIYSLTKRGKPSKKSSFKLPKQGMMLNGQLFQQKIWEPVILDKDFGSLPTPTASDVEGGIAKDVQCKNGNFFRENKKGERWGVKLRDAVSILPTPRANPAMSQNLNLPSIKNHKNPNLETVIANLPTPDLLPTPTAMDHLPQRGYESMKKQAEVHRKGRKKLANLRAAVNPEAVELFNKLQKHNTLPTPSAMEHKATAKNWKHQSGHMLSSIARRGELSPPNGKDMFLNPAFVEEMMGYPIGWLV